MATIETSEVFTRGPDGKLTPYGQAERWTMEFSAARSALKEWHIQADKIIDRYLDKRTAKDSDESRLNLFTANVDSQHAMLFGKVPSADVARTFEDPNDDVARVAAEMWERLLTPTSTSDSYVTALGYVLEDRLLPGFGFATVRYEAAFEPEVDEAGEPLTDEAGEPLERKSFENVETDYHFWKDVLFPPSRTFEEWRWGAWKNQMTRQQLVERFGEDVGKQVPMNAKTGKKGDADAAKADPWSRADVWEIWCKEDRRVYWYVEGFARILDERDDPYGLEGFFPFPKPMIARPTTRNFIPRPDFVIAQDLYNEIDVLSTRINLLEKAVRVAGVYDKSSPEVVRLLSESGFNKMYPAEFGVLAEKGGLKGVVDWFPIEQVVAAIGVLTEKRAEKIQLLQQVTGWADIMRGQSNPNETLGAQKMKASYGSVRIQKYQAEFAKFATDLQRIRAEIIAKHFDAETIIERSNVLNTPDAKMAQDAAALIKANDNAFRIEVKPENINLTDYAQLKQERTEVIGALGGLLSAGVPLVEVAGPNAADLVLAAGQWLLAGVKGGDTLEAEFDNFRAKVQQAAQQAAMQPPAPDPKLEAEKVKAGADQFRAQADVAKTGLDLKVKQAEHGMKMQEMQADTVKKRIDAQVEVEKARAMPQQPMPMMEERDA